MSFQNLKHAFDAVFELKRGKEIVGTSELDPFRALYLKTLFEINGNLDTIAIAQRAQAETHDKMLLGLKALVEQNERLLTLLGTIAEIQGRAAGLYEGARQRLEEPPDDRGGQTRAKKK